MLIVCDSTGSLGTAPSAWRTGGCMCVCFTVELNMRTGNGSNMGSHGIQDAVTLTAHLPFVFLLFYIHPAGQFHPTLCSTCVHTVVLHHDPRKPLCQHLGQVQSSCNAWSMFCWWQQRMPSVVEEVDGACETSRPSASCSVRTRASTAPQTARCRINSL